MPVSPIGRCRSRWISGLSQARSSRLRAGWEVQPKLTTRQVAALKPSLTAEDVRVRAERTLVECILNGATRMRTQVEVDPAIGMRGFDAVQSLIRDYRWAIDIEICVFPQDGL